MNWYPWLTPHYKRLIELYQTNKAHHALLLNSPVAVGSELLANALAKWLMCSQPIETKICHQCHHCRMMQAGTHPDWHVLMPEDNKQTIGVEAVRRLTDVLFRHAQQGGNKLIWIPRLEWLTTAAANALLKTLEEPPENSYFLLGSYQLRKLLATIRSRCLVWTVTAPEENYSMQWLKHHAQQQVDQERLSALRLCAGSPVDALALLSSQDWQSKQRLFQSVSKTLLQKNILPLLAEIKDKDNLQRIFWLASLWSDAVKWQYHAYQYITNVDCQAIIQQLAESQSIDKLQEQYQQIMICHQQLQDITGLNNSLLLFNLFNQLFDY